jgi:acetyl-CoA carboxylase carboxyltransferase component
MKMRQSILRDSPAVDDGIIDPAQTRDVLGLALAATLNAPVGTFWRVRM